MNNDTIVTALQTLFIPGDVFEIRVLDAVLPGSSWQHTQSGYFDCDHIELVPNLLANFKGYGGVYVTLNPVNPDLLARANNRFKKAKSRETTGDKDILCRRWMLVDVDPVRPAGISATEAERNLSFEKAMEITEGLTSMGFASPMCVNSGNGTQLLYRIEIPADDDGLIQRCLQALSPCSSENVQVDQSVHNPARICRLPGTWNRKGDSTQERPHRIAEILELPEQIGVVCKQQLEQLAGTDAEKPHNLAVSEYSGGNCPPAIDDYNSRADIAPLLQKHGWTLKGNDDNTNRQQYWYRPGKSKGQQSATFDGKVFYVFSSNAQPFKDFTGYGKFGVYQWLEHNGNEAAAIEALEADGYGDLERGVDISAFVEKFKEKRNNTAKNEAKPDTIAAVAKATDEPKEIQFPRRLYNVPGLIGEIMDYTLKKTAVPNKLAALCGGISAQAMLAGGKVTFFAEAETRTNIYIVTLSGSGTGKNQPRNTNIEIINAVAQRAVNDGQRGEIIARIKGKFASGQGIVTAVWESPSMLFQVDELDKLLSQLSCGKANIRTIEIEQQVMELYSASTTTYYGDARADKNNNIIIEEPNMCIFGTATPGVFYDSLSADSLRNGLIGRLLPFECRQQKKRLRLREKIESKQTNVSLPESIINTAEYWIKLNAENAFSRSVRTKPINVPLEEKAVDILDEGGDMAHEQYIKAFKHCGADHPDCSIWGRFNENRNKLALIYACSENPTSPIITPQAAQWACDMAEYSCTLLTLAIKENVADTPCHKLALRIKKKIARETTDNEWVIHRVVKKAFGNNAREFGEAIQLLYERGEIEIGSATVGVTNQPTSKYRILE